MERQKASKKEDSWQIIHLPYTFFCPICGKEQQHLSFCGLCGAIFPAECESHRGRRPPPDYYKRGISLESVKRGKWLGLPKETRVEASRRSRLGFLDGHGHPKWRGEEY